MNWSAPTWFTVETCPSRLRDLVPPRFRALTVVPHASELRSHVPLDLQGDPHARRTSILHVLPTGAIDALFWCGLGEKSSVDQTHVVVGWNGEEYFHQSVSRRDLADRSEVWPQMLWAGDASPCFVASPYQFAFSVIGFLDEIDPRLDGAQTMDAATSLDDAEGGFGQQILS